MEIQPVEATHALVQVLVSLVAQNELQEDQLLLQNRLVLVKAKDVVAKRMNPLLLHLDLHLDLPKV